MQYDRIVAYYLDYMDYIWTMMWTVVTGLNGQTMIQAMTERDTWYNGNAENARPPTLPLQFPPLHCGIQGQQRGHSPPVYYPAPYPALPFAVPYPEPYGWVGKASGSLCI